MKYRAVPHASRACRAPWTTRSAATALTVLCAAVASSHARAADNATLYGRLNLGMESVGGGGQGSTARLSNYRSVIGLKGDEALGDGLTLVWQIEGSVLLDTGGGTSIANRDTRIGLAGPWGTAFAGVWTLPYNAATASFDPFYPTTAGYMSLLGNGSAPIVNNISDTSSFDRRQQNVLQYWTPTWQGWSGKLAYSPGEDVSPVTGARPSLWSGSTTYVDGGFTAVLAHELHRHYQTAATTDRGWKLGASWSWGNTRVAGVVERLDYRTDAGSLRRDAAYVSVVHKLGAVSLLGGLSVAGHGKGPVGVGIGHVESGSGTGAAQLTVGAEYALSKRTSVFAFASRIRNDDSAQYDFAINSPGAALGSHPSLLSVGMRHSF
ncbi:Outer membrane protein (porin) [Roseateles sp. YR242]|uniref:porin n=1 Tax=Roseateles sp. YR242 TaxID=1855305 RepID=UPI0008C004CB|nr:porin [Roseateles sp. YR242]SEK37903.1 Outer membrane protein (porin) [Roseateles sp. YR242]